MEGLIAKKPSVMFVPNNDANDIAVNNALLAQLMITVTQIGIRVDNPDDVQYKIRKETDDV